MDVLKRTDLDPVKLAGRTLQKAVGGQGEGKVTSTRMTVGFARYSDESGPMEPTITPRRRSTSSTPGMATSARGRRLINEVIGSSWRRE